MSATAKGVSLSGALGLLLATAVLGSPDLSATGSACMATEPGYEGMWKYCYEITWSSLPHGVSHFDLLLSMLEDCPCVCVDGYFAFEDTVGCGPGVDGECDCTVYYYGLFECNGDPSIPIYGPMIKFEPFEGSCEPDKQGTASLCFYSVAAPVYGYWPDYVAIKYSTESETGDLDGPMPGCEYGVSGLENSTWGHVKSLYR